MSWNPVHGCSVKSPGCAHCYAADLSLRYGQTKKPWTPANAAENVTVKPHKLREPLSASKVWQGLGAAARAAGKTEGKLVFVNSMSDLFHEEISDEFILAVWAVMEAAPQHTYQILTKRPERMRDFLRGAGFSDDSERIKEAMRVQAEIRAMGPERVVAAPGYPKYRVTDRGRVLLEGGSETCLWCGKALPAGRIARNKFCDPNCTAKAHYEKSQGRWDAPLSVREMRPDVGEQGHRRVMMTGPDGLRHRELVHRLVLTAFERDAKQDEQCCHRDGDPSNNALPNLRWGVQEDNWTDRSRHGKGRSHSKLKPLDVAAIRIGAQGGRSAVVLASEFGVSETLIRKVVSGEQWRPRASAGIWVGTSIENRRFVQRADVLRETPGAVRWISAEPLIGPLLYDAGDHWCDGYKGPELSVDGLDWVVVGGESGPNFRPMDIVWAFEMWARCSAAGVPYFFKQSAARRTEMGIDALGGIVREYPVSWDRRELLRAAS